MKLLREQFIFELLWFICILIACNNQNNKTSADTRKTQGIVSSGGFEKINFWDAQPQRGANCMNEIPSREWFESASSINIKWVRLAYDKWETEHQDFLIGDASHYNGLVQKDFEKLKEVISWADEYGLKIVLSPLSLPGCRWSQNNNNLRDPRIWEDYRYQEMAINFWVDLARELKDVNCIIAYDILNEPFPEYGTDIKEQTDTGDARRFSLWYETYKNTPRDLYDFYNRIIREIRKVDNETPIMVESGFYAQPPSYYGWPSKLDGQKILYSVHMYEPYAFTSNNNFKQGGAFSYPGNIPFGDKNVFWDKNTLIHYFEPFENWAKAAGIAHRRIVVSEFGCMRRNPGAENYLEDMVSFLEERQYHWAFYSYREDGWDGYDYELGTEGLPWAYWQAIEQGEKPIPPRKNNALFSIIKNRLK